MTGTTSNQTTEPSGAPLPTTDTTASTADKTVSEIINDTVAPAEAAIIAAEPVLATPILKQLWEMAFSYFAKQIGSTLGTLTGYTVMKVQDVLALKNAANVLAQLQAAQNSGDQNAITQANQNIDAAVAPILHYVGTINPQ